MLGWAGCRAGCMGRFGAVTARAKTKQSDEQAALAKGLLPVAEQFFQLESLSDASSEVWNGLMWEVLQVCVAKTQSAQRFPFMMEAVNDAWEEVVAS